MRVGECCMHEEVVEPHTYDHLVTPSQVQVSLMLAAVTTHRLHFQSKLR
jgi:hypothetical protein